MAQPATTTAAPPPSPSRATALFRYEFGLLLMIALVVVTTSLGTQGRFWTAANLDSLLVDTAMTAIPAIGMTFVIVTAGIDVSVGAILGLSVTLLGLAYNHGWPVAAATAVALLAGLAMGLINGGVIAYLNIPPIITTLGFLSIWSAAIYLFLGGNWITNIPPTYTRWLVTDKALSVPNAMWVTLVLVALFSWISVKRPWGRYLYAIGNNPEAARVLGLPVRKTIVLAYALLGLLAAGAGMVHLALSPLVQATTGTGFELTVIAAVVVGGTDIVGGRGTVYGSFFGALLVEIISDAVILFHIQAFWQGVATGTIILIAVVTGILVRRRAESVAMRSMVGRK
jgi:ribose/xylose/arabinose/galactoside ABC-type transport system permease subunit